MQRPSIVISGSGLYTPPFSVSNEELVTALNAWADRYNAEHAEAIAAGELAPRPHSSAEFIEKASGIKSRYVFCKDGILDIDRMTPRFPARPEEELSQQAEMALAAARAALEAARKTPDEIDAVIVSCSYLQRSYPAIAIEVQAQLGIRGFGFDMLVACSAATFGLHRAYDAVAAGSARAVLVINPELISPQLDFTDRDSHFIFGDVATAMVVERAETCRSEHAFEILDIDAVTTFSNNIRSNFGHTARAHDSDPFGKENLFHQNGRKVFKEVCPMAADHIAHQLTRMGYAPTDVRRWWLHQANINMNSLIVRRLLGRDATQDEAPTVLDRYANTASAGSLIAFNLHHRDMKSGDLAVLCSFGAGYSIGSLLLRKR